MQLVNLGPAVAEDVAVETSGRVMWAQAAAAPIVLLPGQRVDLRYIRTLDDDVRTAVRWIDGRGRNEIPVDWNPVLSD